MNTHYHFVGNAASGDDVNKIRALKWEEGVIACLRHTWVWPLYCQLQMRGWLVSFSYKLEKGAINIIHGQVARQHLASSDLGRYFIIAIRADFRPFPFGQFEIVQNLKTHGGKRIYMPLFPQPGLIPRQPERGKKVVNICFSGQMNNCIDISRLTLDLKQMGCRFVFKDVGQWQDMHDVDVLLGVRSFSKKTYHSKPPTKLFNAWHAGIPFIGGYDSAYEQVGQPGYDYLRVCDYDGLISSITRLKEDPALYRNLVERGAKSAREYTTERITDKWCSFLQDIVEPRYFNWLSNRHYSLRQIQFFVGKMTGCWKLVDWM